ncbi:microtubule-associated tumor suppressor 1 homolog isoform X2 [Hippocampus zosterae]|uniref:microtubule-associated tumor suppressor 1 homolog isoform X2 n=1 Tax=Hippocampus zosterae TaxID=109293 RepID=UPI00223E0854|nr:microtubule-associated tumor suppressor 1 homolog isoform X2 [Hippocampus zosterae]
MSNSTINLSYNGYVVPHKDVHLCLPAESPYNDVSIDGEASSSPNMHMLDHFQSEGLFVNNCQSTSTRDELFCDASMSLSQTCFPTPLNGLVDFCNKSLSAQGYPDTKEFQHFNGTKRNGSDTVVTSPPDRTAQGKLNSCEASERGSTENDSCSMSSGEMVLRSNSFCLGDQSLSVFSSLDESSTSPSVGHAALHNDSHMLTTPTLPVVCEKMTENSGNPYLGKTFTLPESCELTSEEDDLSLPTSMVTPNANRGGLQMTFVCDHSPDHKKRLACVESEPLTYSSGAFTPDKCIIFVPSLSTIQDMDKAKQTSTPLSNMGNQMLATFLESPCTETAGSPISYPTEQQQAFATPTIHSAVGLSLSTRKIKTMEINCLKSDLSNVNSKVVTRTVTGTMVSGSSPPHKKMQSSVLSKFRERPERTSRISPTKGRHNNAFVPLVTKRANGAQRQVNPRAAHLVFPITLSPEKNVGNGKCNHSMSTAAINSPVAQCGKASMETEQSTLSDNSPAQSTANQTFCLLSLEKSPDKSLQKDQKPAPKNAPSKTAVKSGSALRQVKTRPRCSTDTLPSSPQSPKQRKTISKSLSAVTIPRQEKQTKPATLNTSPQGKLALHTEAFKRPAANQSPREINKISLVTESGREGAAFSENSRSKRQTFPNQPQGKCLAHHPIASHRPAQSIRQRVGDNWSGGTPQSKQNTSTAGSRRNGATRDSSFEPASAASVKPQLNVSRPFATPTRPSFVDTPSISASRLPRKTPVSSRSLNRGSIHNDQNEGAASLQVSGVAARKQPPVKTVALKARLIPSPRRWPGPVVIPTTNSPTCTNKGASTSTRGPLKRTLSSRFVGLTPDKPDKNKPKTCSRQQASTSQAKPNHGPPKTVPPSHPRDGESDQRIQNLGELLAASNCRFEAISIVLQRALAERDEATGQCRELSQQLVNLRGELECSVNSSERLEKEKQNLQDALEGAMRGLQEQHQKDLEEMEQRLQAFYQAEWDQVRLTYQGEADKCKALLQTQMEQLEVSHDAMKLELEHSHEEQLQCVKQQHEWSLEELSKIHTQQLQSLDASLKDSEAALSAQIEALTQENADLIGKLTAEENKRRELAESQNDPHTVYLKQELESLKVVLDIKIKQLHQQEKKMIEIDELLERNVKLDERLNKVQQENEDLKARVEKYAALLRQLSAEQAVLQESLQKESNVNKHLSMENEELLWKLYNGEPSSPQKASPSSTSPSHSFSLQSPRSSGACSTFPPLPR